MKLDISQIRIPVRIRKNPGDISSLTTSIHRHGLLHPILVSDNYVLIAGYRRLLATQRLGHKTIDAQIVYVEDEKAQYELELEENLHRKNFTEQELIEGRKILQKLHKRNRLWWFRIWRWICSLFKAKPTLPS